MAWEKPSLYGVSPQKNFATRGIHPLPNLTFHVRVLCCPSLDLDGVNGLVLALIQLQSWSCTCADKVLVHGRCPLTGLKQAYTPSF
jgi:hypothetical protein